ncbi:hypothetical protein [Nostoc sp.]
MRAGSGEDGEDGEDGGDEGDKENNQCPMPNAQYFSTRGYANGFATSTLPQAQGRQAQYKSVQVPNTSLREAAPTTSLLRPFDRLRAGKLSTSQYKCPILRLRSVQVPN